MTRPLLDASGRVTIVAEIGNNHEGDVEVALDLIRRAADAGVDAVKFQTYRTEQFVRRSDGARFDRLKRFELTAADFARLAQAAGDRGLLFLSTPLDLDSARMLEPLVDAFKIASGDITFVPLLKHVASTGLPVVLSTGASTLDEIRLAVATLNEGWRGREAPSLVVLHCVSCYPAADEQASLRSISFLARALGLPIGYSDHTLGIDAAVFAAALGARLIEKHFTLDKQYSDFRDHQLSADPGELADLVARVRRFERMAGEETRRLQPCEESMREAIRRSIVARVDLPPGHVVGDADLGWMRPANGTAPGNEEEFVGAIVHKDIAAGDPIRAERVSQRTSRGGPS